MTKNNSDGAVIISTQPQTILSIKEKTPNTLELLAQSNIENEAQPQTILNIKEKTPNTSELLAQSNKENEALRAEIETNVIQNAYLHEIAKEQSEAITELSRIIKERITNRDLRDSGTQTDPLTKKDSGTQTDPLDIREDSSDIIFNVSADIVVQNDELITVVPNNTSPNPNASAIKPGCFSRLLDLRKKVLSR